MNCIPNVWVETNVGPSFITWIFYKRCHIRSSCEPHTVLSVVKPTLIVSEKKWKQQIELSDIPGHFD